VIFLSSRKEVFYSSENFRGLETLIKKMNRLAIILLVVDSALLIAGAPQGGYSYGGSSSSSSSGGGSGGAGSCCNQGSGSTGELAGAGASFGESSYASRPGSFGASGGGSGGNLNVECQRQEVSPGRFRFVCEGVNKDAISLRSEHILWLQSNGGQQQVLDIEVPNYKIEELIKAGFKASAGQGPKINVLLKKPEQTYDAQVDVPPSTAGEPSVSLQYEPVDKVVVHFPNDKPYSPLSGPILPPLQERGGRPQRQTQKQFSKQRFQPIAIPIPPRDRELQSVVTSVQAVQSN